MSAGPGSLGVVIPTLNEEAMIQDLVRRLLRGGGGSCDRADEVVVADGGSRDATAALAEREGAVVIEAARGRGSQLAAGASRCMQSLLLFLHADCFPERGTIQIVREAFLDPRVACAAMRQSIDGGGLFFRLVEFAAAARVRVFGMVYGDSGLCVRRDAYLRAGGFRPLPIFEDVDLCRRLRRQARPILLDGARVRVSARRWKTEGVLRATVRNRILLLAYRAGVDPERLLDFYPPHRKVFP